MIAVPDLKWGETVKAVVVPAPAAQVTAAELIAHARDGLARYKCPTAVDFVDAHPRTTTGKVQKSSCASATGPTTTGKSRDAGPHANAPVDSRTRQSRTTPSERRRFFIPRRPHLPP